jgi:hypothetical protein
MNHEPQAFQTENEFVSIEQTQGEHRMNNIHNRRTGRAEMWLRVALAIAAVFSIFGFAQSAAAAGAVQISGTGAAAGPGACIDPVTGPLGQSPDFSVDLNGDLAGCLYVFVESYSCTPSGVYIERGTEIYVGGGDPGDDGQFTTTYLFTAKFSDCDNLSGQFFGRCQHPIVAGSGTGDYEGVTGRLDFKDNVETAIATYRGHLRFGK